MFKKKPLKYGYYFKSLKFFLQVVDPFCSLKGFIFTKNQEKKFFVHFSGETLDCYKWASGCD